MSLEILEDKTNWMIGDLHLHSRFARACSKNITFENLVKWATVKGLDLLGSADFTHPIWWEEFKEKCKDNGKGFFYYQNFAFVISGEISLMYKQEKSRKVHLLLLVPDVQTAEKIHLYLDSLGRRDYDGRPIFGVSCEKFVEVLKQISKRIEVIPAHIWTPYFGVLGSKSGFNSLKECFGEQVSEIFAVETGLSSDLRMNWKIKELEDKSLVSFSDSHSYWPWRLGREATIFRKTDSYDELIMQIRKNSFLGTIEVDPAYGIYHYDGHKECGFSCNFFETKKLNGFCPVCKKGLTLGVEYRVNELESEDSNHLIKKPSFLLLPLHEIISLNFGVSLNSKRVWEVYEGLIKKFGSEFNVLMNISREDLIKGEVEPRLVGLILRNRVGKISVKPGYDGVYGVVQLGETQGKLF